MGKIHGVSMTFPHPSPPSITPRQMNMVRLAASMAWSDGDLAPEEIELMLDRFSCLFSDDPERRAGLRQELQDYVSQNIPLEELTPKLATMEEREFVLRLGYEVIGVSALVPGEDNINDEEAAAYRRLVKLLNLSPDTVARIASEVNAEMNESRNIVELLEAELKKFIQQ